MSTHVQSRGGRQRRILVSGASIAGPTLAYWLNRYGFDVTVVERAAATRNGGYAIDIRGTALDVIEKMGLSAQVRSAHIASRGLTFVDAQGKSIGSVPIYDLTSNDPGQDVEIPRGKLTDMLYGLTRDTQVRYRFGDSIEEMNDDGRMVNVRFNSGDAEQFDAVIGADGLHSNTRRLVFGPEQDYSHYLGFTFNIFSMPNDLSLCQEAVIYAEPGRIAGAFAVRGQPELFCFLVFATDTPPFGAHPDKAAQIARTVDAFSNGGWQVPRMIDAMKRRRIFGSIPSARFACRPGRRAALRSSGTPPSPRRSARARAPAWRWPAPTCWPGNWQRTLIRRTRLLLTSGSSGLTWRPTRHWCRAMPPT